MDDIRTSIIQSVMQALSGKVDDSTINLVQDGLIIQLNKYEVQERCTEVAVRDDSAEGVLKKYIATKRVEGTADSTLKRYAEMIYRYTKDGEAEILIVMEIGSRGDIYK